MIIMIGNVEVNNFILFNIEDDDMSGILFRIIFSIISCWNFISLIMEDNIFIFFILFHIEDHDRSRILFRIIFSIFSCRNYWSRVLIRISFRGYVVCQGSRIVVIQCLEGEAFILYSVCYS